MEEVLDPHQRTFWFHLSPAKLLTLVELHDAKYRPETIPSLLNWFQRRMNVQAYCSYAVRHSLFAKEDEM